MIVICKKGTTQEQIDQFTHWLHDQGMEVHLSRGTQTTLLGLVGDTSSLDAEQLASLPFVERVQRISEPYKKANRKFHPEDTVVDVSGRKLGGGHFCMIAGPCSVESAEQITEVAQAPASSTVAPARSLAVQWVSTRKILPSLIRTHPFSMGSSHMGKTRPFSMISTLSPPFE